MSTEEGITEPENNAEFLAQEVQRNIKDNDHGCSASLQTTDSVEKQSVKDGPPFTTFDVNAHGHKPTITSGTTDQLSDSANNSADISGSACKVGGEYREISSDNDEDDDENDVTVADNVSSDPSSPSQISPNHRIVYSEGASESSVEEDITEDEVKGESTTGDSVAAIERPDSLSLPKPFQNYEKYKMGDNFSDCSDVSRTSSTAALIEEASKTPLNKQGTVTQEGDMIQFVADGLNEMIKLSSSLSLSGSSLSENLQSPGAKSTVSTASSSASAWSEATSSASEWSRDYSRMSRIKSNSKNGPKKMLSPSILTASPEDIPSVDPRAVMELEVYASKVAMSVQNMTSTLKNNLLKMSALSYHNLDAYKDGVDSACDSVDASIKAMYALMAKCEELSKSMQPVYSLHTQIKEIERLLDLFEAQMAKEEK